MRARDFGDIDEIQAGIHVRGKLAIQEIQKNAAGGRGLGVVGADGRGRIQDDDLLPILGGGNRFLFGEELRPLVVAHHVFKHNGGIFVDDYAVGSEVHRGYAGGVDEALDAGFARKAEKFARAVHVGAVHRLRVGNPEAVIGGNVDNGVAAGEACAQGFRLHQVADIRIAGYAFKVSEGAGFAHEHAEVGALGGEGLGDVVADKAGCAGCKDFHTDRDYTANYSFAEK